MYNMESFHIKNFEINLEPLKNPLKYSIVKYRIGSIKAPGFYFSNWEFDPKLPH